MFDDAFLKGETWGFPGQPVEQVETHAAHVFLAGDRAFKIKKPVKLPYLDFSDVEKRRSALLAELEINRLYTPDLYLGLQAVRGEPVLVMRRFSAQALLGWIMAHGDVSPLLAEKLAVMVVEAHARAPRRDTPGADIMMGLGAQLSKAFIDSPDIFHPAETLEFHALFEARLHAGKRLLSARGEQGLVRRCHGDMHSGNIIVEEGTPKLFDAIEFSEKIATVDVLYDLAFLLMDLWTEGERRAANTMLNRYLHLRRDQEDLSGLALLPLFLSTRAGVRALVTADLAHELALKNSMKERGQALDWFRASIGYLKPPKPRLVCIGGLSGTGKSTLAAALAPEIGAAPGALHVRSDVERKVLAGMPEAERLPPESYSQDSALKVYDTCLARAERGFAAGHAVIFDAVFAGAPERRRASALAERLGCDFTGIWLEAPAEALKARVSARAGDASDATADVVERQLRYDLGCLDWHRINASGEPDQVLALVRERLRLPHGGRA